MSSSEKPTVSDGYELTQLGPIKREIPLHWDVHKLGSIANINMGSSPKSEYYNEKGEGLPFFQGNADFGPQHPQVTVWCTNPNKTADEGDLLLSVRAPVGDLNIADQPCCIGRGLAAISEEEADNGFLYYLLSFERPRLETYAQGSTFKSVNSGVLNNFPVQFPSLPEQCRIANILSTVDEKIQQTDEIIEKTKELRYGLRQDLVFGKGFADDYKSTRLGARNIEIPSGWEVETFSDVAAVDKGNTPKTSNSDYYGGDIVWVTPDDLSNMYERGEKYISDSRRKITDAGLQSTSVNIVSEPSVMFTSRSYGIGKTAICTVQAATNQGIIAFHPGEKIGVEYLYYYLNQIMDYIIAISGVSNFPEVSLTDIRNLRVPVPSKDDQERIESVLQLVDERLVKEQNTKRLLHEFKHGLMQDLLTGKVRVNTD